MLKEQKTKRYTPKPGLAAMKKSSVVRKKQKPAKNTKMMASIMLAMRPIRCFDVKIKMFIGIENTKLKTGRTSLKPDSSFT